MDYNTCYILNVDLIESQEGGGNNGGVLKNAHVFDARYDYEKEKIVDVAGVSRCGLARRKDVPEELDRSDGVMTAMDFEQERQRRELALNQDDFYNICGKCVASFYSNDDCQF